MKLLNLIKKNVLSIEKANRIVRFIISNNRFTDKELLEMCKAGESMLDKKRTKKTKRNTRLGLDEYLAVAKVATIEDLKRTVIYLLKNSVRYKKLIRDILKDINTLLFVLCQKQVINGNIIKFDNKVVIGSYEKPLSDLECISLLSSKSILYKRLLATSL